MGLRGRLKRAERKVEGKRYELVCPECGEAFTVYADAPLEYLAWEWARESGAETHRQTPASILRVFAHEHDPGAFLEKGSGLPFLSREVSGINISVRAGGEGGA